MSRRHLELRGLPGGTDGKEATLKCKGHEEDPTWHRATKPVSPNYWANALSLQAASTEACVPEALAPQQEKPPQWEDCALQLESCPCSLQLQKNTCSNKDPAQPKNKYKLRIKEDLVFENFPNSWKVWIYTSKKLNKF